VWYMPIQQSDNREVKMKGLVDSLVYCFPPSLDAHVVFLSFPTSRPRRQECWEHTIDQRRPWLKHNRRCRPPSVGTQHNHNHKLDAKHCACSDDKVRCHRN